jgi:hypothetical protein
MMKNKTKHYPEWQCPKCGNTDGNLFSVERWSFIGKSFQYSCFVPTCKFETGVFINESDLIEYFKELKENR